MGKPLAGDIAACRDALDVAMGAIAANDNRAAQAAIAEIKDRLDLINDRALALQEAYSRMKEEHVIQAERNRQVEEDLREAPDRAEDLVKYEIRRLGR